MRTITERGNLWELAVLCLLREGPMHPYQMQRLLKERHKDEVLALKRGSLYHAIDRLTHAGRIQAVTVGRAGRRPERTTYRLTAKGEQQRIRWLRQRIATPQREPVEFVGSLNFLVYLAPSAALAELEVRAEALEARIGGLRATLGQMARVLHRINRIESEFLLAMSRAELSWVRRVIADRRAGRFEWDLKAILKEDRARRRKAGVRKEGAR